MTTEAKVIAGVTVGTVLIIIAGLFLAGSAPIAGPSGITVQKDLLVRPYSPQLIGKTPKVSIVEFGDFECPSCAGLYPAMDQLLKTEGDNISFTFRIIPIHQYSVQAGTAAFAAGAQGKFWGMYDILFPQQNAWSTDTADRPTLFDSYAKQIGLDVAKFDADIKNNGGAYAADISQDQKDASAMGIDATPTLIIDGTEVSIGAIPYDKLKAIVDAAIASTTMSADIPVSPVTSASSGTAK